MFVKKVQLIRLGALPVEAAQQVQRRASALDHLRVVGANSLESIAIH